jgi:hypothetical protein
VRHTRELRLRGIAQQPCLRVGEQTEQAVVIRDECGRVFDRPRRTVRERRRFARGGRLVACERDPAQIADRVDPERSRPRSRRGGVAKGRQA